MPTQTPGAPTEAVPLLEPSRYPGFQSAARANGNLNLEARGSTSQQFGCGGTHGWAVCGDSDFAGDGEGAGCYVGFRVDGDLTRNVNVDVAVVNVAPATFTFTIDDLNGTGIGALLDDWFVGGTANQNTTAPVADSIIEIGLYNCTLVIGNWQITSVVQVTPGQTYQFVLDTTLPFPGAGGCSQVDDDVQEMVNCLTNLGVGTHTSTVHSQGPEYWGVVNSQASMPLKCETEHQAYVTFRPRVFAAVRQCDDPLGEIDWGGRVQEDLIQRANAELSCLLETDDGRQQNPSLISTAVNLTPGAVLGATGTAVSVIRGFQILLDAFTQRGNGLGTFHGSANILPWALYYNVVTSIGDNNLLRGPLNLPYNPGPGFKNARPVVAGGQPDGSTVESNDVAWLYGVTNGQVEYRIGLEQVDEWSPASDADAARQNKHGARAEHKAMVRFNTCGVFAVQVCTADIQGITVGA